MHIQELVQFAHSTAKAKGWWDDDRNIAECIALMHSELSEALEGARVGNKSSDKIPQVSQVEEEFADVLIRIADYCGRTGLDLERAVSLKLAYNSGRKFKHGKEF